AQQQLSGAAFFARCTLLLRPYYTRCVPPSSSLFTWGRSSSPGLHPLWLWGTAAAPVSSVKHRDHRIRGGAAAAYLVLPSSLNVCCCCAPTTPMVGHCAAATPYITKGLTYQGILS
ncbi:MAG: hypothetical protein SH847_13190, partial [Roseiflexaceae bacterium]|nr:hypothetical protein [Roseiflexaceae bacterium]